MFQSRIPSSQLHVHRVPALRRDANGAVAHRRQRGLGERLHLHEPLVRQPWLHHRVAAVAVAHAVLVRLHLHEPAGLLEHRHHLFPRVEAVGAAERGRHAARRVGPFVHRARLIDHDGRGQMMPEPHLEIVRVVRRRDLHHAGTEGGIGVRVRDHGDLDVHDRQHHLLPDERGVALVVGIHGHRHVAEHRLRPRRGDDHAAPRIAHHRIGDVIELAVGLHRLGFFIAERRETARAPVDHAVPLVDQAVFVEPHERLAHRARQGGGERVRRARPVAARADRFELLEDRAPRFGDEGLRALHERVAAQVVLGLSLSGELLLDDVLRRDPRVIRARHPEGLVARHPPPANEHILHGVVESVAHVQNSSHIRRRDHDHEGVPWTTDAPRAIGVRGEDARVQPAVVDVTLDTAGIVLGGKFGGGHYR